MPEAAEDLEEGETPPETNEKKKDQEKEYEEKEKIVLIGKTI